jgi:hypothetical protein
MNRFVLAVVLLSIPMTLPGQVVETPEGVVEFIGLRRWTIPMIQDSMAVHAPNEPLGQCAVLLKQLGFVSASARLREGPEGQRRMIVTVVEPDRADRIRLRVPVGDSLSDVSEWRPAILILSEHNRAFQYAIQWRGALLQQDTTTVAQLLQLAGDRAAQAQVFWQFLDKHRGRADLEKALQILKNDRNGTNAAIAAAILTNFPEEPQAWWALLDAHREAVSGLLMAGPRKIDWVPVVPAIRALLDGTNVFVLEGVLSMLASTGVDPDLAPALLREGGGDLVLARLRASNELTRRSAHSFLVQISRIDRGDDPAAWEAWIASL